MYESIGKREKDIYDGRALLWLWDLQEGGDARRFEHRGGCLKAVAVTPDGRHVVSGTSDGKFRVWDLTLGTEIRTFSGEGSAYINSVAVTPDGRHVVSGAGDGKVRVWDLTLGTEIRTFASEDYDGYLNSVAVTPDGRRVVSGGSNSTVRIWDFVSGTEIRSLKGHGGWVTALAVMPDGQHVVSGSDDCTVRLWDVDASIEDRGLKGHKGSVCAVDVTPDGQYGISGGDGGSMRMWDLASGDKFWAVKAHEFGNVVVVVSPDGRHLVSGSDSDYTVQVWDLRTRRRIRSRWIKNTVNCLTVTSDSQYVLIGDWGVVRVWTLSGRWPKRRTLPGHVFHINSVAVTPDNQYLVSGSLSGDVELSDEPLKLWELGRNWFKRLISGSEVRALDGCSFFGGADKGIIESVAVTSDGRYVLTGDDEGRVRQWSLSSGAEIRTLPQHMGKVNAVAVTADCRYTVSAGNDRIVRISDFLSGREVMRFNADAAVTCIACIRNDFIFAGDASGALHLLELTE